MTTVESIPTAHTPAGGWYGEMPAPVLAGCSEPLADGAPDLRGTWRVTAVEVGGAAAREDHPAYRHVERIEQAAHRVCVTGGGVVHDMWADGTFEHGVRDVAAVDFTTPIEVAATFEDGVLVLRPRGLPVEVRRWRDGDAMMWQYGPAFTARLVRTTPTS